MLNIKDLPSFAFEGSSLAVATESDGPAIQDFDSFCASLDFASACVRGSV